MVRSIQIPRYGGPEVLKLVESEPSLITPEGVRIRVAAAGVNFADLMMRMGMYPEAPPRPFVPGYEIAGTVTEVGAQVAKFKPGDRVLAGTKFGGYTTEVVLSQADVWKTPSRLSDIEAAAIPVNFLTAWLALCEMARVRAGDRVLIPSAAGGVGTAAVQIAARAGAWVTGLVGTPSKAPRVLELGAREVLSVERWESMSDAEAPRFEIILDATGGKNLKRAFRRLTPAGKVVHYGVSGMIQGNTRSTLRAIRVLLQTPFFHPLWLMKENKGVFGINVLQLFTSVAGSARLDDPEKRALLANDMDRILESFEKGEFQVVVGKVFPLAEASAAHQYLQSRANVGKVILDCR